MVNGGMSVCLCLFEICVQFRNLRIHVKIFKTFWLLYDVKNAVNSVLNEDNPVEEIIELSKGSRKINDHISDELSKALSCVSDYYKMVKSKSYWQFVTC